MTKLVIPRHMLLGFYQEQPEAPKQTALKDLWTGSVPFLVDLNLHVE